MRLTSRARRALGVRASDFVDLHHIATCHHSRDLTVPDYKCPDGIARTLTRVYGRATTIDRGEIAYWLVPSTDVEDDDAEAAMDNEDWTGGTP